MTVQNANKVAACSKASNAEKHSAVPSSLSGGGMRLKLSSIYFAQPVVVPFGKESGDGEARSDLRESSFTEADGWTLSYDRAASEFALWRAGMLAAAHVIGYAASYVGAKASRLSDERARPLHGVAEAVNEYRPSGPEDGDRL